MQRERSVLILAPLQFDRLAITSQLSTIPKFYDFADLFWQSVRLAKLHIAPAIERFMPRTYRTKCRGKDD